MEATSAVAILLPNMESPQTNMHPLLQPGWTLNYEMFFYVVFAACLLLPRKPGLSVLVLWLYVLVAANGFLGASAPRGWSPYVAYYGNGMLKFFIGGVLLELVTAWRGWQDRLRFPVSPAFLLLIAPFWVLLARVPIDLHRWMQPILYLAYPIGFLCILTARGTGRFWRGLVFLGNASYSTYLCHVFVLVPVLIHLQRLHGSRMLVPVFVAAAVLVANGLGALVHVVVERPLLRVTLGWLKRLPWAQGRGRDLPQPTYVR